LPLAIALSYTGLAQDGRFDMKSLERVLALRAKIEGNWGSKAPEGVRYIDLGYYERALQRVR